MDIDKVIHGVRVHNTQYSKIDRANGLLTSHDTYAIYYDSTFPEVKRNIFSLQIYSAKELEEILYKNGFRVMKLYDMRGDDFNPAKSINILTIAKKFPV